MATISVVRRHREDAVCRCNKWKLNGISRDIMASQTKKKWSKNVTTDSTHPQADLFTKDPETIARSLASKKVSPKGPGSGMRMLTFYINRAGKNLSANDRKRLEKAKGLLSERVHPQKNGRSEKKSES